MVDAPFVSLLGVESHEASNRSFILVGIGYGQRIYLFLDCADFLKFLFENFVSSFLQQSDDLSIGISKENR